MVEASHQVVPPLGLPQLRLEMLLPLRLLQDLLQGVPLQGALLQALVSLQEVLVGWPNKYLFYCLIATRRGPTPEIDPYKRQTQTVGVAKGRAATRKKRKMFGASWIYEKLV